MGARVMSARNRGAYVPLVGSRIGVVTLCLLALLAKVPTKSFAEIIPDMLLGNVTSALNVLPHAHGRSLAAELGPAAVCNNFLTRLGDTCVPGNICPATTSGQARLIVTVGSNQCSTINGQGVQPLGTFQAGVTSFADCCTLCSTQLDTCGGVQYNFFRGCGAVGCYLIAAADCVGNPTGGNFRGLINANTPVGYSAPICPPPVPDTPTCKSLTLTAGPLCTAPTPSAADVITSQLPPGASLDQLIIGGDNTPPPTLTVSSIPRSYSLTISNSGGASTPCRGVILVQGAEVPTPFCKTDPDILTATVGCSRILPRAADLYGDSPLSQRLAFDNNPSRLLVGQQYFYSLIARACGTDSAPCRGSVIVQAPPVPTPLCKPDPVVLPATSGCAFSRLPTATEVYGDSSLPLALTIDSDPPLLVGRPYQYSLTASGSCGVISAPCNGTIIVQDAEALDENLIGCPGVSTIAPSDANTPAAAFTATYLGGSSKVNGCPVTLTFATGDGGNVVTCDRCNKQGKHEVPDCAATVSGNNITVINSGGNGNHISYTIVAKDGASTSVSVTKTCGVCVENKAKGGACTASWVPGTPAC